MLERRQRLERNQNERPGMLIRISGLHQAVCASDHLAVCTTIILDICCSLPAPFSFGRYTVDIPCFPASRASPGGLY